MLVAPRASTVVSPMRGRQGWFSSSDDDDHYSSRRVPTPWCLQVHNLLLFQTFVFRRPRLSACHQVFSRPLLRMPTAHLLASARSTARCVFVLTTVSRVTEKMTATGSTPGAPSCLARADREPAPEFLEQSPRRSPGPALCSDQRSWRQTDKLQILSWNPGPALGSEPRALADHLNGLWHVIGVQESQVQLH